MPDVKVPLHRQAELHAAQFLTRLGYTGVTATASARDGGIDILGDTVVAQVKWHSEPVGTPSLQAFVGAVHGHTKSDRVYFSQAGYTAGAIEYGRTLKIKLLQFALIPETGWIAAVGSDLPTLSRQPIRGHDTPSGAAAAHRNSKPTIVRWEKFSATQPVPDSFVLTLETLKLPAKILKRWKRPESDSTLRWVLLRIEHRGITGRAVIGPMPAERVPELLFSIDRLPELSGCSVDARKLATLGRGPEHQLELHTPTPETGQLRLDPPLRLEL